MNVVRFVAEHPDVRVGVLALAMGLRLDAAGLAKAGCALRHAKRYLRAPLSERVSDGLRDVACREVDMVHARVKVAPSDAVAGPVKGNVCARGLERGTLGVDEESRARMRSWGYIADPRGLSREGRAAFDPGLTSYDGRGWAKRLMGNLVEAHGVVDPT